MCDLYTESVVLLVFPQQICDIRARSRIMIKDTRARSQSVDGGDQQAREVPGPLGHS